MSTDDGDDFNSKIAVLLIGVGSAAFVVTIYHCLSMGWCNRYRVRTLPPQSNQATEAMSAGSMDHSAAQLIPAYKYQKGVGEEEEITCAICLSEFEEGEDLKTLPECLHTYHEECIDMWLYSHSNCPMCRSSAIFSPEIVLGSVELSTRGLLLNPHHNVGTLQNGAVHEESI